jgi:hypothetical protein
MAVGIGLRHIIGADRAVGAGLVLDNDALPEQFLELVGQQTADEIGRAAGRKCDHHADGSHRVVLCLRRAEEGERGDAGGDEAAQAVDDHACRSVWVGVAMPGFVPGIRVFADSMNP